MADKIEPNGNGNGNSKLQGRGISYPVIGLEESVSKAQKFFQEERKAAAPIPSAMKHFGYAESSGMGRQTVSALLQFGLLADEGIKDKRQVKLTDRALTIILDQSESPARVAALQECVCAPKLYSELLAKWPDGLPSDHTISFFLQKEKDFNPKTLQSFISDFRASLAYAKLAVGGTIAPLKPAVLPLGAGKNTPTVKIGDFVQWENSGILQFTEPRRVTGFSDDQQFLFVADGASGLPVSEVTIMQAPATPTGTMPPANPSYVPTAIKPPVTGSRQDIFSLDEGAIVLQWPEKMSQESFEDFEAWMQIQLRKIKRSIN